MKWTGLAAGMTRRLTLADLLLRIDEQPFPIERDDLNLERRLLRHERPRRIEVVRADPDHAAEQHDRQKRDRPGDHLDPARILKVRKVYRPCIGRAEPPCEGERGDAGRHHDRQHDDDRVDEDRRGASPDFSLRVEDVRLTARQGERQKQTAEPEGKPTRDRAFRRLRRSAKPMASSSNMSCPNNAALRSSASRLADEPETLYILRIGYVRGVEQVRSRHPDRS